MTFKELLAKQGITGYELDKRTRLGISPAYLLVSGKKNPLRMTLSMSAKVAEALNMTLDQYYEALKDSYKV